MSKAAGEGGGGGQGGGYSQGAARVKWLLKWLLPLACICTGVRTPLSTVLLHAYAQGPPRYGAAAGIYSRPLPSELLHAYVQDSSLQGCCMHMFRTPPFRAAACICSGPLTTGLLHVCPQMLLMIKSSLSLLTASLLLLF